MDIFSVISNDVFTSFSPSMVTLTDSGEEKKKIERMLLESSWFYVVHGHKIQLVLYSVVSGL